MTTPIREYINPPKLARILKYGDKGEDVKTVQKLLQAEGYFSGTPLGNFLTITQESVQYFQNTHIDKDGEFLEPDGRVGEKTWWALHNAHGSAQRSFIPVDDAPAVTSGPRVKVLQFLYDLHKKGVSEIPDGSNYGDGVTGIVNACGFKYGIAWCLALQSHAEKEANGAPPLGAMHVSCYQFWNLAMDLGVAHLKKAYTPVPGDIAIYSYGKVGTDGKFYSAGHALRVAKVSVDGTKFNALEGNVGNRLKHSTRSVAERTLVGYVNLYGDAKNPPKFARGISEAPSIVLSLADSR